MDEEEKLRLLYVACTRARDHLLVAAHHVEGVKSFAQMVWTESEAAADSCRLVVRGGEAVPPRPGPTVTPPTVDAAEHLARRDAWLAHRADVLRAGARRRTVSATALRQELASGPGSRRPSSEVDDGLGRSDLGPAGADVVAPEWRRGRAATAFGRAVHAVLEHADLDDVASLGPLATDAAAAEGLAERAPEVEAAARSVWSAPAVRAAAGADSHRELYVAAAVGDRVVEGYVDLLVRTDAGLVIVDYKTDLVGDAAAPEARLGEYGPQLAAYALAVETSTGLPVVEGVLVFAGETTASECRIPRSELEIEAVRARLAAG